MKHCFAANRVVVEGGRALVPGFVEIAENGSVARVGALDREMPFTEWLGGTIEIVSCDDCTARALYKGKPLLL